MYDGLFDSLPAEQREHARAALKAVTGSTPIQAIMPVLGGASGAHVFRVDAGTQRYLLRIEGPASPLRNPHQYAAMRIAAEAGIAPRLYYADERQRIAILDFIAEQPLETYPGGSQKLLPALGEKLRELQATPAFPHFIDYPEIVSRLFAHVRRTGLMADGLLEQHFDRLKEISDVYRQDTAKLVSSHNDSNPRNILFDGKRLWLIDWESAYCNDPLVDVAIVADSLAMEPELEAGLLRAWHGRKPDEAVLARFKCVRALTRLYFAGVMLSASAAASWRDTPDGDLTAPTLAAFRQSIREGHLKAGTPETRHVMGKMFLAAFLLNGDPPGFESAV